MSIPIIDGTALVRGDTTADGAIRGACREWGVFYLVHHGIEAALIERVWDQTRRFFALPRDAKLLLSRTRENPRGYYDRELTKNKRDLKEVFDFGSTPFPDLPDDHPKNDHGVDGHNQWPQQIPEFRQTMAEYFRCCEDLGLAILASFCRGLDVPADRLRSHFLQHHTSFVRLNHYPLDDPLDRDVADAVTPLGDMALHHHTDAGALTILLQDDVGGLQAFGDGAWIDVEPVPGSLVVNLGDMTQVWSNDRYHAALHRVLPQTHRERYSLPFFFNPSYATDYAPLESVVADEGPRYGSINWGEFRRRRTDGDYADYGTEVQISDYRTASG